MVLFNHQQWSSKSVYIVEEHHHVLQPWFLEYHTHQYPLDILTLDHHTDVLTAFAHYQKNSNDLLSKNFETITKAITQLRHDEHLDYAVRLGIVANSIVFSHVNYSQNVNPLIKIVNFQNLPEYPSTPELLVELSEYYGCALESSYLQKCLNAASFKPSDRSFILDIDLDYFKSNRSVHPQNSDIFRLLIEHCICITISMERDWVRLLNQDWEKSDSDYFLHELKYLVEQSQHQPEKHKTAFQ